MLSTRKALRPPPISFTASPPSSSQIVLWESAAPPAPPSSVAVEAVLPPTVHVCFVWTNQLLLRLSHQRSRLSNVVLGLLSDEELIAACGRMIGDLLDAFYRLSSSSSQGHFLYFGCQIRKTSKPCRRSIKKANSSLPAHSLTVHLILRHP